MDTPPSRPLPRWRIVLAVLVLVVPLALWFGVPPLYHWVSDLSSASAAESLAVERGLRLTDADTVVYAESYSSFPDSSAYVVVESESAARATEFRRDSGLAGCGPGSRIGGDRLPTEFRSPDSPTLRRCSTGHDPQGGLRANWDPEEDGGRRTYVWAYQV